MLKSIYDLGNALNKAQMIRINGSTIRCSVGQCWNGQTGGGALCVPCSEDRPPKE